VPPGRRRWRPEIRRQRFRPPQNVAATPPFRAVQGFYALPGTCARAAEPRRLAQALALARDGQDSGVPGRYS
jgi:hypothetical protein